MNSEIHARLIAAAALVDGAIKTKRSTVDAFRCAAPDIVSLLAPVNKYLNSITERSECDGTEDI